MNTVALAGIGKGSLLRVLPHEPSHQREPAAEKKALSQESRKRCLLFNALPLLVTYQVLCTLGRYHSQGEEKSQLDILANLSLGRCSTLSDFSYLHQSKKFWGMGFSALSSICTPYLETGGSQKWSALEFNLVVLKPQLVI